MNTKPLVLAICCLTLMGAVLVIPIARLTLMQRLYTAPPSTLVRVGTRIETLAQLRAQHRARELVFSRGGANGTVVRTKFLPLRNVNGGFIHAPIIVLPVLESPSQYGNTPADMQAFCSNAHASACAYVPPQQEVQTWQGAILDEDALVTQPQCQAEGGDWGSFGWGVYNCGFTYPLSVVVNFTPAKNYKFSSTAQCDKSLWQYTVDVHGAISIQLVPQQYLTFTTSASPWCVVYVTPGQ